MLLLDLHKSLGRVDRRPTRDADISDGPRGVGAYRDVRLLACLKAVHPLMQTLRTPESGFDTSLEP